MDYKLIQTDRKTIELQIGDDLGVIVRAPRFMSKDKIESFVESHKEWIEKNIPRKEKWLSTHLISPDSEEKWRKEAADYLPDRTAYYAKIMGVHPTGIKITSAKRRFGSCNGKNSICYSFYLMAYPKEAVDYVIVHELSHIVHKNHGSAFYAMIRKYMPDYEIKEWNESNFDISAAPLYVRQAYDAKNGHLYRTMCD
mgnify:CR=1 FL=1